MTEREINEKISAWIGRECSCVTELNSDNIVRGIPQYTTYWGDCAMHSVGGLPTPYVTSDRCAVDLLPVLVERGYQVELANTGYGAPDAWGMWIFQEPQQPALVKLIGQSTIAAAISGALIQLIESI